MLFMILKRSVRSLTRIARCASMRRVGAHGLGGYLDAPNGAQRGFCRQEWRIQEWRIDDALRTGQKNSGRQPAFAKKRFEESHHNRLRRNCEEFVVGRACGIARIRQFFSAAPAGASRAQSSDGANRLNRGALRPDFQIRQKTAPARQPSHREVTVFSPNAVS